MFKEIYCWDNISVFEFVSGGLIHSNIAIGVFRIPGGPSRHITMLNVKSSDTGSWPPRDNSTRTTLSGSKERHHNPRDLICLYPDADVISRLLYKPQTFIYCSIN